MMQIKKILTPYNFTDANNAGRIKYIVIHYVGALGGAEANCKYYASQYIGASAHYFVGFAGEVMQSVEDEDIAWHCGAGGRDYRHPECRNTNSIGIEMCVRNKGSQADTSKDWYFEPATVQAAIALTRMLMEKYKIPAANVIRHYDVTGKICPNPYVYNQSSTTWDSFKRALSVMSGQWIKSAERWWYCHSDGSCTRNGFEWINGRKYLFDSNGWMLTGIQLFNGERYYLCEDLNSNEGACMTTNETGALRFLETER